MKIDRARLRIVRHLEAGDPEQPTVGLVLAIGTHQWECWPITAITEHMLRDWADRRLDRGGADEAQVLAWIERQFVREELPKLSAHQRIAMIRDGLLVPVMPHPGRDVDRTGL
ncbi:MAG TPA: hypothetical protein PKA33_15930 [Amaricoccus sp.]|uniref:hypothetical protein n=1 Tax=Amaricoccus sp. TaxID=1872485 RepID=UPI002CD250B5|nr:hypothetical protein [Amaricoccus sp.]HMQ92507.1 hypothetical protein [Amaricoccus sp.]HMR53844.1 hypothetical protein [Amaricoccus sp.]HMR58961.1 hypothetical protein [Amaricoccus sp.]HMU00839.1 hypothetical protein [Amaricoccus sp.]